MVERKPGERIHPTIAITNGLPIFLCEKERQKTQTLSRLPISQWLDHQKCIPTLISELIDKLAGAKYFTKLDVWWGYNNIRIKDGDQWKAVFKTNKGLFEPTIMFFGLCNLPATFQSMMDSFFEDLIKGCIVIIYMDDIFLFAKTPLELENKMKRVLQRLQKKKLNGWEWLLKKGEYLWILENWKEFPSSQAWSQ